MRRLAPVVLAALVPVIALALPAGAQAPSSALAPGAAATAHGAGAFTGGYQESTNENNPFVAPQYTKFSTATASISGAGSQVSLTGTSGSTSVTHSFAVPPGAMLQAGQTYLNGIIDGGACTGAFEVDDLSYSGSVVESAGIQYEMDCATSLRSNGFGNTYSGAIAFKLPNVAGKGYYLYDSYGVLTGFGNNQYLCYLGAVNSTTLNAPIVGMAATHDGAGYWMVASDGGIFAFGDAQFHGSTGNIHLNWPIVGMAAMPDGGGYWLVGFDGGIFSYGDARFHGSVGNIAHMPVLGMATTPDGGGYWLVADDGGVFTFGDAHFYGSTGNIPLVQGMSGITATSDGRGYWLVSGDGGIFSFGDAGFFGSVGGGFAGFSGLAESVISSGYIGPPFFESFVGLVHT